MRKMVYVFLVLMVVTACSKAETIKKTTLVIKNKPQVVLDIKVTNRGLFDIVKKIAPDKHFVDYMFNDIEAQWKFSFTEDSLINIAKEDLFIYTGANFEPWISEFLNKLNNDKVTTINASRGAKLNNYTKGIKYKDQEIKENPYYFMSVENYKIMALNIKNIVQDKDPENRDLYEENFSKYMGEIDKVDKEDKAVMEKLKDYTFIVEEEEVEYYLRYHNLKWVKILKEENLTLEQQREYDDKLEKKLKEIKKPVYLYANSNGLKNNEKLIVQYNMKSANISVSINDRSYIELLNYNRENLKKLREMM